MPWEGFRCLYREQQEAVESYYRHLLEFYWYVLLDAREGGLASRLMDPFDFHLKVDLTICLYKVQRIFPDLNQQRLI